MKNISHNTKPYSAIVLLLVVTAFSSPASAQNSATPLDINDISFLWPVPKTKADAEALISLADEASDGPILPLPIFKALMEKAKSVRVGNVAIRFPDSRFDDPKTWKVAGIRVNPTALGTNPGALARAEVPGIRLIVQPVTVDGDVATPHDFTAHVVFNYVLPPQPNQPVKPDKDAFGRIVQDLREIKRSLNLPANPTIAKLNVHPGFSPDPVPLTNKLKTLLKKHLSSQRLDRRQVAAISFMGIPGAFEPWIFFKVEADTSTNTLTQKVVSGKFDPIEPTSQMISFFPDTKGKVVPAPLPPKTVTEVSTALLFPLISTAQLDNALIPGATDPELSRWKMRDVADLVANPQKTTTLSTDCVSCHTESTRRHLTPNLTSQPGSAFALPAGISGVAPEVLPRDRWNLRNFGWGFNFDGAEGVPKGFQPTISQRAANEAAESVSYINEHYPEATAPSAAAPPN